MCLRGIGGTSLADAACILLLGTFPIQLVCIRVVGIHICASISVAGLEERGGRVGAVAMRVLAGILAIWILRRSAVPCHFHSPSLYCQSVLYTEGDKEAEAGTTNRAFVKRLQVLVAADKFLVVIAPANKRSREAISAMR